jgi:hypothetical protein
MKKIVKASLIVLCCVGVLVLSIVGAYWWSNVPPRRPLGVSASAVFLWAGHLGLPAPKHGTWIECWPDTSPSTDRCRLTAIDGQRLYEGEFVPSDGRPAVQSQELRIQAEPTSDTTNWIRVDALGTAPLIFLEDGDVLIPKEGYVEGAAKLEYLRHVRAR